MNRTSNSRFFPLKDTYKLIVCIMILLFQMQQSAFAQLVVTEATSNAEGVDLIENVFLGSCVSVSNVVYRSSYSRAVGEFSNGGTTNIGLDGGIIMTSGRANLAIGPNNSKCAQRENGGPSDSDLAAIASAGINDRTVLEFDFIPQNDTLTFQYVFASEEYHEWVNAGYNDAFGFFISGPGFSGPYTGGAENIALIPGGTTPVTIDNVNNGAAGSSNCGAAPVASSGPCTNCSYFVDNTNGTTIQYDAFTRVLTATAVVTPCVSYHIKLAVGDAGDEQYDSGVFLKGGSFSAGGGVTVEIETTTIPPGIYEGCADAWFIFRRVDGSDNTNAVTAAFTISGTATPGVDYTPLPSSITIPAGQDSILVPISVALDFITEGSESITVTLQNPPCACEAPGSATVDILDNDIPLAVSTTGTTTICLGQSANLTANPAGSQTPYTSGWNNGAPAGNNVSVSPTNTTTYTYTVVDACGGQTVSSSETITVIRPDFTVDDDEQCFDGNNFSFTNTGATGGSVTHLWDFGDGNSSNTENPSHSYVADGDYTVTHYIIFTASNCTASVSALVTVFPEPVITATVDQDVICSGGTDGVISTSVSGGTSGFNYLWSPGGQTSSSITGQSVGTYTVTVTDANGCTDSDSETIVQNDPVDPTAVCQNITIQLNGSGNATISATQVNNGSSDNCGIASMVVSPNAFSCSELGANTVTLTVTDVNGNTDDCSATVTVEDNIDPVAACTNVTVQLDASGNASIVVGDVDGGATDNCSVTVTATPLAFTCANVGANTVVVTATDGSGNTDNCNATVTVQDLIDPTAICQDITIQLDGSGNATITASDVDNGSNDNCSVSLSATPLTFNCGNTTGTNTVTLTATDPSGNSDVCTAIVTVEDNQDPTVSCQDITVQLNASGTASITSVNVNAGSSDNCSGLAYNVTPSNFTCANIGVVTVTLTVTDPTGNSATCTADVTVEDNIDPTAVCQNITVQLDASGNASIVAADVDGGSSDNCSVSVSATPLTFTCAEVGTNTVVLTATDPTGNSDNCNATVTVEDNVDPTAICQDVSLTLNGSGTLLVQPTDINNGSNDACGISGMFANPAAFDCADVGANSVTLTVTDNNSNVSTCVATVTVVDDEDPTAVCQNITVQLDGSGNATITAASVDNGSSDNCSATLSATPLSFTCANTGANNVTLTATDPSGNTDNCVAVVTIEDDIDPTAICQNITVQLDASGNATITAADVDNGSSDNCSVTLSATPLSFTCANTGTNNVTLTATDPSGNTDNCVAVVTIEDDIDPTAICQNITVQLDASGNATITAADVDNGSSDNCSVTLSATPLSFTCANTGVNNVTLTATDPSGNTDNCVAVVTIEDDISPTAICQDITVQLDGSGNASIAASDVDNGSNDNCSVSLSAAPLSFTCANTGSNTVTLTATDPSGNSDDCIATVTVEDAIDPTAICQNITIQLDASGNASITAADVDDGSSDNCSVTVAATPLAFTCANVGANTVILTATDGSSNTDNCNATVTVQDNIDPTAVCQNITVQLDANGDVTVTSASIDGGSTDNCGVASVTIDGGNTSQDFDCSSVGANTITLTVTDVNGNTSTCDATVTIEDSVDPTAVCQNITIQLDGSGNATLSTVDIDNGSVDNCGIASITLDGGASSLNFDCSDVGTTTVTLTVTDVNSNVSTCTADVTIEDNIDANAICQDITVQLDANGDLTVLATDIDNGSSDNCGSTTITINGGNASQDFDCSDVGVVTITLTVTDANSNVSTCDADVTIEDNVDPTAVCQNITVQLDANGDVTLTSASIDGGSTDNCGVASVTIDGGNTSQDFDCSDVGANNITLTVTDVNGNTSTCNATVTIEDTVDPTAVCQNIIVQLDANGDVTLTSASIDGGSTDNCGVASVTIDGGNTSQDFDCSDVGANTITLTVTDVNGNTSTCNATVTIEDTVDPTAVCQNITVQLDANGDVTLTSASIDGGSTDNCGVASVTIDGGNTSQDFDCSDVGANTITLTVTDVNGNTSTCNATVTIEDSVDPTAVCQNITVQLDANGDFTLTSASIDGGSTDNCGVASVTIDGGNTSQDFDCSDVGANTITLTVTDVNGNTSTCNATVTIEDTVDPTAVCQNITVQLDANGDVTLTSASIDGGSTDNCGVASVTIDGGNTSQDFDCSDVGVNTITLTVTDVNGNTSTCNATVTIEDTVDPTAVCQNITVQLDANGDATITGADIDNGSTDNCGIASLAVSTGSFDCSSVGSNTVTLTVTDVNGNTSTCNATVTIEDNVDPTAVCQNITIQLDANGDATIVAADIDGGSTDNCAIDNIAINVATFDCSDLGNNLVTLTITDVNGNTSTCSATVEVEDIIPPTPVCIDIIAELSPAGSVTVAAGDVDNGSSDNCAIQSITLAPNTFNCSNVGFNTVTLTVTDISGNVSTCTAQVDVQDNVLPTALCQSITVQLDGSGNATITPTMVNNGSTDACGSVTPTLVTPSAFTCADVGVNTVTLTVEDQNGNISTCATTVTIQDTEDPVAVCQNITVQLDGTGNVSITPADVDGGSTDNCAIDFMTVTPNTFTCAEEGPNTVTLTVTDVNGNTDDCTATVTVENNIIPTVSCQDITIYLDASGNVSIVAADVDGGSNAACGIASLTVNPSAFNCSNVGPNTVTLTGTDNSGNVSTCTAVVTVVDDIDPTAVCQNVTIQLDASGAASIVAADVDNASTDNCAIASLSVDQTAFGCAEVGTNTVTLTVTDVNGNASTCTATVTVEDNIDPTIVCQNITVELDATGNVSITAADIDNGTTDNCSTVGSTLTLDVTPSAFDCNDVGTVTVMLTATDENGNSSTCTADVTVEDNEAPTALCQNLTIYLDAAGNQTIVPADIDNGSSDNCAIATMVVNPNSFTCSGVGANPVTLTVTDVNGNVASCMASVTVLDTISPTAICQDITVQVDAAGNASIVPSQVNNGSTDACGIADLAVDVSTFNCSVVGGNTVVLTVTDDNGNTSTCTSNVTVEDNVAPNALCQGIMVQLDANGDASIVASQIDNSSTDNCAIASLSVTPTTFNCTNVGANTVTLTVTDVNGNTDNCTATVTVEDNINPTAVCQNITVQLDANGDLTITSADIDNGSNDNCGIASLTINGGNTTQDFDCSNVGANTVTLTVTDVNGNVSTCDATVTVEDNVDPIAICQNITVQLDANGDLTITSADIDNGSNDNCGIASLTIDGGNTSQDFECSNVGGNTVTLTVTDVNGNVSTCDATVTVEDNVDPIAICQNITVQLDANGDLTIASADIDNGSNDNCGIASLTIDGGNTTQDFDCSNVGANTVTLTVTDVNGNVSTCDATVTVEDNVDPIAICQNITVQLDANGDLTITSADIDNGSNDNCGIASLTIDGGNTTQDFDCSNVGANTVTLTVTDVNGNVSTCDATVTVEDNVDPIAICQNITVQLDANGDLTITSADIDNGSNDNCGIASLTIDGGNTTQDFDCSNVGANTVTLTVTDVNGNVSTCDATITVEDNVNPIAICQNITVQLDANGDLTITSADIDNGSNDNCGIASLTIDGGNTTQDFDCSNVGANTVTLTVTDVNGNVSTCDATVTVEDNVDPIAICQNITVQLDANGDLTITSADIDNGSTDNCGVASLTIDGGNTTQNLDCSQVGANTITLTVTDVNGNVSTCDATVTVEDNVDPTVVCQNITIQLDATGNATISSVDLDGGSSDNCGIATFTIDGGNTTMDFDCADEGTNTITLTVTDVNGNVSTCDATVTVENNVNPNVFCQDITVYLDATGNIGIIADDVNGGSNASCGLASLTVSPDAFDCSNIGPNTVTLTAVDNSGNTSTCDAIVTVLDTISPTAVCQNITVQLDANGDLTIASADIDNGSNDNCGIASLEIDGGNTTQDFDCSNVGANTVTLTVTDVNGNVSTCDATVTVEDNVDPNAICQNITVQLDANGDLTITSADIDNGSNDNCGIASLTIDGGNTTQDFDCSNVGANTVTLTATDVNGNISTCDATVTVEDNVDPNAICQNITVQLDVNGDLTITSADIDNGSNDNCGIASLTIDGGNTTQDFDCSNVGANTVTLTVTDVNGNVSTCDATITVEDNVDPIAICQNITVQLDANGDLTIASADINNGSNDNCGIASLEIDGGNTTQDFDCSNVGANTVTLTVTDVNGNVSTCDATVTVEDTISPIIVCQNITIELDPSGTVVLTAVELDGGTTDNCGSITFAIDATDTQWTCADVGIQTITLTATDANGNVSTCDAQVTIENNVVPTVSCQDITVYLDGTGNISIDAEDVNGGSNASCGLASLTVSPDAFDCSNIGANTVTLTATDSTGNVTTCDAIVTVLDTISPNAVCQNITVDLDANGDIVIDAANLDGGSSDNCGVASVTVDSGQLNTTLDCSTVGANTVTVTVTDVNGNVSTCDATVTVEDNTNPTAECASVTVQLDANGETQITPVLVDNGSFDNCGIDSLSVLPTSLNCNNIGSNSIVLTVYDVNGNISTCVATVTAQDTISPTPVCTDITVQLTTNGTAVIAAGDIDDGSYDNCGIQSLAIDVNSFTCSEIGGNTVELTVTDVNGNSSTCTANANVVDEVDPNVICQNLSVYLDANGQVTITANDIDNGSSDACGIDTMTLSVYTFDCSDIGVNPVTLTVTDNYGNFDICQAIVRVFDTIPPVTVCQDITIQLDATGTASIVAADVDGGSTDNCGIGALSVDQTIFDCTHVGANTVTLTVVDVNGNQSTCDATVTVEDNVNPNANCQDITIHLDAAGNASINASDINGGSNANCGVDTVFVSQMDFDCSHVGNNTVTLTVVDNNGNQSTCTANVEVLDTISPTAICQDLTTQVNAAGEAGITAGQVDNSSFDNCGIQSLVLDDRTFDCSNVGVVEVVLTVTDVNGNVSTCTSNITVQDTISPNATCTPIVVQLGANGTASITADEVDLNSSDNCAIDTMTLNQYTFNCSEVGTNTVTLTVTDVNGNSSTCDAEIIVEENLPPVTACQDITIYLDAQGDAAILPTDVDNGSTDNCAIDTMYVTPNDFTCSGVGLNPVVLTVVDVNGNVSSCNAVVTVNDTISPIAICQDIVVQLDTLGNASIDAEEIDNGSSDACGITGFTVDVNTFDCSNVGGNTVVLTVEDNNGNSSTCSATVTIEDNINPIVSCLDLTVTLDGNGTVNVSAGEFIDSASDNCAVDTIIATQIDFSCADLGSNIITVTVIDVNGNSANCSSELTVLDTLSPVIIACPMDSVIVPDSSDCSPQVFWTEPTATDNCTPTLTSDFAPGDNFPVGTTTVTYTATDESNNSTTCSFDITIEPSPVVVDITSPEGPCGYNLSCSAVPNGEATANVSGGCLPYNYLWTDGQTTQTASGLAAGLHGVTVTDANGTSVVQTIILTEPEPLTTDSLVSPEYVGGANISCNGEFDGAVSINVLGGEECVTYDFAWTGPNGFTSTDEDLTGLEAGTYVVVVSDASGCSYTDSITLVEPAALDVDSLVSDYNGVNVSCGGAADGFIDLTISGGATPYSVTWSNGESTEDIDSLTAGTYTYTVVDANGCEVIDSITLTEPDGLTSAITTSDYNGLNISCFGLSDGSIDLTVNDGTQPYSFLWNNNETTEDIDSLEAGTYIVNITDANGCTLTDSVTLVQPDSIVINPIDTTIISCNGMEDGAFTVEAVGGVPTFTYDWSNGQTGPTASDLGAGTYTVVATDINGCQDSAVLVLTQPFELEAFVVQVADVICYSESNGIIDVNVLGGTSPYAYDWSNDSTTQDLNGVAAGIYSLEVTDANGCTDTLSVVVDEPTELTMNVDTVINATCSGAEDGSVTVEAAGGTAPYTYFWPNLSLTGPTAGGLTAGVYEVVAEDANGCSWSMNVTVGQPTSIEAQLDIQSHVSCNGLTDGSALVTVSGGTAPYTYFWSNSDTDSLATGFGAGVHTVNVSDAGGCDTTLTFVIDEPSVLTISVDTLFNVSCNGVANGQIEVDVEGGTIPYSVTWSNGDAGYVANDLGAGTHTVYVTDGNGCTDSLATVITQPDTLELVSVTITNVLCKGGDDGEATVLAQGGTAPLTYNWPLIGQTGNTATGLSADTYTFVVTDANGCSRTDTVQITEPEAIAVTVTSDTAVCPGSGVTITASATGGAGNYSYSWDNGLGLGASHFVSPSVPTTYSVEAFDQSGCSSGIFTVTVDIAALPVAAFSSSTSAPCVLPTDIEFTNMSTGATAYQWLLGNGTLSSDVNPTATYSNAGTYTVTLIASSGAGCSDTVTGTVIIDDVPTADFTLSNAQGCAPLVVNFGNNSTTGLEYYWDFGDGTTSTISNPIHVYEIPGEFEVTLVVTSAGGCTDTLALGAAVSVYPSPIADFTPNQVTFPEPGNEYEFVNNSTGASLYNWDFGNGIQTDEFQPTHDYSDFGGYFVTLTAINEFGCADTAVHYINVELFTSLHVPNAVAIGGIGESAIFLPKGTGIAEYHLWIFDNWGNLLWESTRLENGSPAEGWDGVYKGAFVPQGSYVWKINATFIDGEVWDGQDFSNGKHGNSGTVMVLH